MTGQTGGLQRLAAFVQVVAGGHHHPRIDAQKARTERRISQRAHADRQVNAMLDQIDITVFKVKLDLQLRMHLHEAQHQRRQDAPAKGDRGTDTQLADHSRLHQRGYAIGFFNMVRDQFAFFVVQRANFGRRHTVGRPVQQTRAELFFKMRHQLGG